MFMFLPMFISYVVIVPALYITISTFLTILSISLHGNVFYSYILHSMKIVEEFINNTLIKLVARQFIDITLIIMQMVILLLFISVITIVMKFMNDTEIFNLLKKPIPSVIRYREYLILLLKRLTVRYEIIINDMEIYRKTLEYLRELANREN